MRSLRLMDPFAVSEHSLDTLRRAKVVTALYCAYFHKSYFCAQHELIDLKLLKLQKSA